MITVTVPREARLLTLAAAFLTAAAEHVTANPQFSLTHSVGELASTVEGLTALEAHVATSQPEHLRVEELQQEIATSLEQDVETAESTLSPHAAMAAFAPKASMFNEPLPPEYEMTDLAAGFSREDYHNADWTDQQLLDNGYMVAKAVAAPVAAAPTAMPAPPVPKPSLPSAPAPTVGQPTQGATGNGATLIDSAGTPWDARIHAGSQTFMKSDGTWKLKKGVDKGEVARITAELKQLTGNAAPAPTARTAPAPGPSAPAPVPKSVDNPGAALMRKLTTAMAARTLTFADVLAVVRDPRVGLMETKDLCVPGNEAKAALVDKILFGG